MIAMTIINSMSVKPDDFFILSKDHKLLRASPRHPHCKELAVRVRTPVHLLFYYQQCLKNSRQRKIY